MHPEVLPEVKSRPVYGIVEKSPSASLHLFISPPTMPAAMQTIYESCADHQRQLLSYGSSTDINTELAGIIPSLMASTAVYIAGTEPVMWAAAEQLREAGMLPAQINLFEPLDYSRQVFCCHCYHLTYGQAAPLKCGGCGRLLTVTDHFSRKHGAYFGYQVNAEDINDIPEAEAFN